jgi:hypothetical protein
MYLINQIGECDETPKIVLIVAFVVFILSCGCSWAAAFMGAGKAE